MKNYLLILLTSIVSMVTIESSAQNCGDKLRTAIELKKAGITNNDIGKLNQAIYLFRQVSQCDPDMRSRCNKEVNSISKIIKSLKPDLTLSTAEVTIPYQGGVRQIDVVSNGKWNIEGNNEWCDIENLEGNSFAVKCLSQNNDTRNKITELMVKNGSLYRTLKIIQEGRPEYIEVGAQSLSFPAKGTEEVIKVESNANWDITSVPSWCKVKKNENDSTITIIVSPNDRVIGRTDDIVIVTPTKSVTIKLSQGAGEEQLMLSQNDLVLNSEGDVHDLKVYTDAENWFVGDYPNWLNVQKIGNDSIRIICGKNIPNGEPRSGSVQVKTDRQTTGVLITQSPRMPQDLIFPDSKIVGGRNFSFGISASYYVPFVSATAGGDYVGSVVDYGLGTSEGNAHYKNAVGYSFGLFADMRLYKNIFLTAGVNFSQVKYKNHFNKNTIFSTPRSPYQHLKGEIQNSYTENYTQSMLEVPILASYRFKLSDVSHVQINLGPVLNYSLSAKMRLTGNSDGSTLHMYNSNPPYQIIDNSNYPWHTAVNAVFNLHQPCVSWTRHFTQGNDADQPYHDTFQAAPYNRFNCGLRLGVAYEWAGISVGIAYTQMLTNMANKNYWDHERWTILNNSDVTMKGYKLHLNTLEIKIAYTLRYLKNKKK